MPIIINGEGIFFIRAEKYPILFILFSMNSNWVFLSDYFDILNRLKKADKCTFR